MPQARLTGSCLCGAVRFELSPPLRDVIFCHCRQCAKWTGSAVAATAVSPENFTLIEGADALAWYSASKHAERGFCARCGSSLFWKPTDGSRIAVLAGTLDQPTGLVTRAHVFVADKSDFYDIADDAPHFDASGEPAK
ncbi:MAG: GFA family protein [Hyphomicrobium sp.]